MEEADEEEVAVAAEDEDNNHSISQKLLLVTAGRMVHALTHPVSVILQHKVTVTMLLWKTV